MRKRCVDESDNDKNISLDDVVRTIRFFDEIRNEDELMRYMERTPHYRKGVQFGLYSIETGEEAWRGDASAVGSDWNECFADDDAFVAYRLNTAEIREVRAQNGERIKLDSESLLSSPNPACSGGYLVYAIDRTGTPSMPNKPDVGIISLKDEKTFRISKVNMDQFGNGKVFVSLDAAQ